LVFGSVYLLAHSWRPHPINQSFWVSWTGTLTLI